MRQLNDRPKSQTAKTSSEQVPYRSLVCKHKSSFAALLLLFPKSLRLFGNPYTSERLMYCGALGQHSACRQAGVPVGTLTRRKRQAKNYFKKGRKRIWKNRFIRAEDVAQELNVSKPYAYKLIRQLNEELKAKGFITIAGRVNRQYFYERLYGAGKGEM